MADEDADDDASDAGEAAEELADAIGDLEEDVADLKDLVEEHPDAALKRRLQAEVDKIEQALASMRAQLDGGQPAVQR